MKKLLLCCFILAAPLIILFINILNLGVFVLHHLVPGKK